MSANVRQPDSAVRAADAPMPTGEALLPPSSDFAAKFNRTDFVFPHGLAHHPMFEPAALAKLAARIPKIDGFVYWQNGKVKINEKWGSNPAPRLTLEDTIEGIAHNDSLVILKHAEQDPVYGPVLQEILQRIWSLSSPEMQADIVLGESLIFLNSPNRKTAYHLDLESNFLLQIAGVKQCHVFDCTDRAMTPHVELEGHCGGNHNSVVYKPEREKYAHCHRLLPGQGVHFPSMAPHWVQNEGELSISININYDLISVHHRLSRVYRVNRTLRRFGITPTDPGRSPLLDGVKRTVSAGLGSVLRAARRRDPARDYPAWRPAR